MSFSSLFSFHAFSGNKPNLVTNATLAPINVTFISNTATSITVSFTPPGGTVTGYTPYVNGVAATGSGTPASYTITGLTVGTSYNIVIYASMSFSTTSSGSFLPTSIPGSLLWLDAADTATITTSGSNVTQWNDKSGNGYNFTQGTTASQPTYSAMANGKNAINLATSKFMSNTSVAFPTSYTIFAVGYTTTNGYGRLLQGSITNGQTLYFGSGNGNTNFATVNGPGTASFSDANIQNSPTTSVASLCLMEMTNNNTSTGLIPYVNGTALTAKNGITTTFTALVLGASSDGTIQFWNGYVAEILIYNSVLTSTQQQQVEGYLAWKWGLQASLPVAHTYYSAAPTATSVVTKTYTSDGSVVKSLATAAVISFYLNNPTYLTNYYRFEAVDISGTTVLNYATGSYDATLGNGLTTTSTAGNYKVGTQALNFVSTGTYATSPYLYMNSGITLGSAGLSFAIWFYSNSSGGWARVLEIGSGPGSNEIDVTVSFSGTNRLAYEVQNSGANPANEIDSGLTVNNSTWFHMVWTINTNGTWLLYINGALYKTSTSMPYPTSTSRATSFLGKSLYSDPPFNGYMDDYRIYNCVLSANDVKQLYAYTGAVPSATYFPLSPAWTPSYSSLVAYFMLDEAVSSTSAVEQIGAYNGTVVSGAAFGTTGKVGTCATFNGSNSYISVPYQVLNNLTSGTIMAWIYFTSLTSCTIIEKQHDGYNSIVFSVESGYLRFTNGPGVVTVITSSTLLSINTWYHVAYTFTSTSATFYINGKLDKTVTPGTNVLVSNPSVYGAGTVIINDTTPTNIAIGAFPNNGGMSSPFAGQIDDLSVWNTSLTADNIATIYSYQSTGVGSPTGLTFISSTTTSVTFSFTAPAGTGITYTPYVNGSAGTGSGTPSSYTITGLTTATAYSITLTATVSGLTSTNSVAISVITPISGEVFALSFGSSSTVPTTDKYGATLSTATGTLSMYNDATRGYVLNLSNAGMATTYAASALSFTRACWYYNGTASMGTYANLLSTDNSPFFYTNSTQISLAINFTAGAPYKYATDPVGRGSGSWVHYAATYDGTTAYFYTNGSQVASLAYSFSTADTSALRIGYYAVQNVNPSAYMDNIHVYNRVLAASEILALYTAENSNPKI